MRAFLDTSVLVGAIVQHHERHASCARTLEAGVAGNSDVYVSAHGLAELFAVLTRLPVSPRLSPALALTLIRENVLAAAQVVTLSRVGYLQTLEHLANRGLAGGVVYDAIHYRCAVKARAEVIYTLNVRDYERVADLEGPEIRSP